MESNLGRRPITACSVLAVVVLLQGLSGCRIPVVQKREFQYVVSLRTGERTFGLSGNFTCYLRGEFLDMRGPRWAPVTGTGVAVHNYDIAVRGETASGTEFEGHPFAGGQILGERICDGTGGSIGSRVFFREPGAPNFHSIDMDQGATASFGEIRVLSSALNLVYTGHSLEVAAKRAQDDEIVHRTHSQPWYSISARILRMRDLPVRGLRPYVEATPRIWIGQNRTLPFDEAARRELSPSFDFREALWPHSHLTRGDLLMEPSSAAGEWEVNELQGWAPFPGDPVNYTDLSRAATGQFPTCWIDYRGSRIEMPLALLAWRFAYDPSRDVVVVFRIEVTYLADRSPTAESASHRS
jgi:hypothetical protein